LNLAAHAAVLLFLRVTGLQEKGRICFFLIIEAAIRANMSKAFTGKTAFTQIMIIDWISPPRFLG